jgi:hypothetical protein
MNYELLKSPAHESLKRSIKLLTTAQILNCPANAASPRFWQLGIEVSTEFRTFIGPTLKILLFCRGGAAVSDWVRSNPTIKDTSSDTNTHLPEG